MSAPSAWPDIRAGRGEFRRLRSLHGPATLYVVDGNLDIDVPDANVLRIDIGTTDLAAVRHVVGELTRRLPDTVVGVGGGSALDIVKLACLLHGDDRMGEVLTVRADRAGLVVLPASGTPRVQHICVPTTIGTAAEVSRVACFDHNGHKRLVMGIGLRPGVAVLDPDLTATLPDHLLLEGVFEALMRTLGPAIGSPVSGPDSDRDASRLVRELVAVGDRLAAGCRDSDTLLAAARSSAATQTGRSLQGRGTYSPKHWYIANEAATVLGLRKMVVTAALVPSFWAAIDTGDSRFGYRDRLYRAWGWAGEGDPVGGVGELLRRWGIRYRLDAIDDRIAAIADRTVTSWGGRLPMLGELTARDVRDVLCAAREDGSAGCST